MEGIDDRLEQHSVKVGGAAYLEDVDDQTSGRNQHKGKKCPEEPEYGPQHLARAASASPQPQNALVPRSHPPVPPQLLCFCYGSRWMM